MALPAGISVNSTSALNDAITKYSIVSTELCGDVLQFVRKVRSTVKSILDYQLQMKKNMKYDAVLVVAYTKPDGEPCEDYGFFHSNQKTVVNGDDVKDTITDAMTEILILAEEFEMRGSGLCVHYIVRLDVSVSKYIALKGSSYVALPKSVANTKSIINVQNTSDHECFKWCVYAYLYPTGHPERISQYRKYDQSDSKLKLNFDSISFPMAPTDAKKFETANKLSVNVYALELENEDTLIYPIFFSKLAQGFGDIKLLFYEGHYMLIRDFDRLLAHKRKHRSKCYFCPKCLHSNYSKEKFDNHTTHCKNNDFCQIRMPASGEKMLKFRSHHKTLPVSLVIDCDLECYVRHENSTNEAEGTHLIDDVSYTKRVQKHVPYAAGCVVVETCCSTKTISKPVRYRCDDAVERLLQKIIETADQNYKKRAAPIRKETVVKKRDNEECYYCKKQLGRLFHRDHCHTCGKFRGWTHPECNLGLKASKNACVLFHNLRGYDSHLLFSKISDFCADEYDLECIPKGSEDYLSFSLKHRQHGYRIRFIDSFQFLPSSLDNLAKLLEPHDFKAMAKFFDREVLPLLLRKPPLPYDRITDSKVFDLDHFPPLAWYHSILTGELISKDLHARGQRIWDLFKFIIFGEYCDLYLEVDILLLVDIFEKFREFARRVYGLDPCHYITLSAFSLDACLRVTEVELELLEDPTMYEFIEKSIRGGLSMIVKRQEEANNPYLPDHDWSKPNKYIMYYDVNNLYGTLMTHKLPISDFEWCEPDAIDYMRTDPNGEYGYLLEVDLTYPRYLHDRHNDYPLAIERLRITPDMYSQYSTDIAIKHDMMSKPTEKLSPNFFPKHRYVTLLKNLQYCVHEGLVVEKVHRILRFKQVAWIAKYVFMNTKLRQEATSEFDKDLFKLLINCIYGKTMENVRKYLRILLATTEDEFLKIARKPSFSKATIFNDNLVACHMLKRKLTLDKPICVGACILELAKDYMYRLHYDYFREKYGEKASLLMTDTDSLVYSIETDDVYEDMYENMDLFDTSNYNEQHILYSTANKKRLGKLKDECGGIAIASFVGLRSKMYSYRLANGSEHKRAKGIKKNVVKGQMNHKDYLNVLRNRDQRRHVMNSIRSYGHELYTIETKKRSLSAFDNKRYILPDGIHTLAYNHCKI